MASTKAPSAQAETILRNAAASIARQISGEPDSTHSRPPVPKHARHGNHPGDLGGTESLVTDALNAGELQAQIRSGHSATAQDRTDTENFVAGLASVAASENAATGHAASGAAAGAFSIPRGEAFKLKP